MVMFNSQLLVITRGYSIHQLRRVKGMTPAAPSAAFRSVQAIEDPNL